MTVCLHWPEVVDRLSEEARKKGLSLDAYVLKTICSMRVRTVTRLRKLKNAANAKKPRLAFLEPSCASNLILKAGHLAITSTMAAADAALVIDASIVCAWCFPDERTDYTHGVFQAVTSSLETFARRFGLMKYGIAFYRLPALMDS